MLGLRVLKQLRWMSLLLLMPAWVSVGRADDMEVYNMTTGVATGGDVNIVFMLDNSGSMKDCMDSTSDCTSTTNSRMYGLRSAMSQVLTKLADTTRVALFTYGRKNGNVDGGTMLAPMRALSDKLPDGVTTHRQYMLDWFEDSTKTGTDRYLINNNPPNWKYNFGPKSDSKWNNDPPVGCTSSSVTACQTNWNDYESGMYPRNSTPLESAYAEIGSYLLGKSVSDWGITYLTRTGKLAQMGTVGSGSYIYYSKILSTLNAMSTSPITGSGSDYTYLQPSYTQSQTCVTPSWHVILVTDGIPNGDGNRVKFSDVLGSQQTCDTGSAWSCSKEMALFLANKSRDHYSYDWTCLSNCGSYLGSNGVSATPTTTPASTYCDALAENNTTQTTTVKDYKAYNWSCKGTTTYSYAWVNSTTSCSTVNSPAPTCNAGAVGTTYCKKFGSNKRVQNCTATPNTTYAWACDSGANGGNCTDGSKPTPTSTCNAAAVNAVATTYGNYVNRAVTWQCHATNNPIPYENGLGVKVKTDAIFVGPDTTSTALTEMTNITNNGDGIFKNPTSVTDLANTLIETVNNAEKEPTTISAPGVAVNQLSRFNNLNQLYYSVFQPDAKGIWEGNLKRYILDDAKVKDSQMVDAVDSSTKFFKESADSCWGQAASTTKQPAGCLGYTQNDGKDPTKGGMRSKLNSAARSVLTTTDGSSIVTLESLRLADAASAATVTTSAGLMGYGTSCASSTAQYCNGALTALGGDLAAQITNFNATIDWTKGVRAGDSTTMLVGDPLHSQPVVVSYGFTGDSGTGTDRDDAMKAAADDPSKQENYLFYSTNAGALHAVDASNGDEKFAFIPKEMLPLLPKTMNVPAWTGAASRIYGLDSTWLSWRHDANKDNDLKDSGDWSYLYGGMRMGGSNYYALDVTNLSSPTIKWTIKGALAGGFNTTTDSSNYKVYRPFTVATVPTGAYAWMGQTWSKPTLAYIALNDGTGNEVGRTVLVFGGGYDPTNETTPYLSGTSTITPASTFGTDAYGHQLYIVDAKTGNLLFWASGGSGTYGTGTTTTVTESPTLTVSDMKYSITGSPVAVDRDDDGFTDLLYFADLGGQVFRLDLKNKGTNNGTATSCSSTLTTTCAALALRVARIATLGEAAAGAVIDDQRRFFEAPGVAIVQRPDTKETYMALAIGSGNRSHPAYVGTRDRVYVLKDESATTTNLAGISAVTALTHSNLQGVTTYDYSETGPDTFAGKKGFYFDISTPTSGNDPDGEKAMSSALIYKSTVYISTYVPESTSTTSESECSPGTGSSYLAQFNVFDGRSEVAADDSTGSGSGTGSLDGPRRPDESDNAGLPPEPQIILDGDKAYALHGTSATEADSANQNLRRTRWYELPRY